MKKILQSIERQTRFFFARLRLSRVKRSPQTLRLADEVSWLTLPNLVIAAGGLVVVLIVAQTASPRVAVVVLALLALTAVVLIEGARRRKWERTTQAHMQRLGDDNLRLMRDIARQRQDMSLVRETLAGTGAALRAHQSRAATDPNSIEQRMLRTIATELSKLETVVPTDDPAPDMLGGTTALDMAIIEHHAKDGSQIPVLTDDQVMQLVRAALQQDRIDLFTQPIVTLPQRKARFVETFSRIRIRPGVHMPAERYIEVARDAQMLPAVDNLLLLHSLRHLRVVAESDPTRVYFCNITSLTLHDPKFMTDLVEFIAQNRSLAPRLVFEMEQRDLATMRRDVLPVLAGLAHLGCRFSMDQVRELNFSAEELSGRFVRFVKIDAAKLVELVKRQDGIERLHQIKAALDLEGIDLIVEKVESEKQLVELLDIGIDYGQGYLFGHPTEAGRAAAA